MDRNFHEIIFLLDSTKYAPHFNQYILGVLIASFFFKNQKPFSKI